LGMISGDWHAASLPKRGPYAKLSPFARGPQALVLSARGLTGGKPIERRHADLNERIRIDDYRPHRVG